MKDSRESRYLYHCRGCQNCYGCFDLENKEYAIFNKSYSPEEYRAKLASLLALPQEEQKKQVRVFLEKAGYKKADIENIGSENVHESRGVNTSKNISFSRCIDECEDVRYASDMRSAKVVLDSDTW